MSLPALEETISSLSAPPIITLSSEDEPANEARTSGAAPAILRLKASILEDYPLAHELFIGMLLLADATKLLVEPHREVRRKAMESFIWIN